MLLVVCTSNPQQTRNQIEALPNLPAIADDSILFLDEIQAARVAIAALL
jgi:hypothetical protein